MTKRVFRNWVSAALITAMLVSTVSIGPVTKAAVREGGTATEEERISYAFDAESIQAEENLAGDARMPITITRSGRITKPSEMVLISCDINADYGGDYTLSYGGEAIPRTDGTASMYSAFRDNKVVSDYEDDNKAFVDALLSGSGSTRDEGKQQAKGLMDADAEGANFYDSLSTLDKAGAVSTRTVISFDAGEETKTVELTIKKDVLFEYSESFLLGIVSPKADKYLQQHAQGIPDIPLKEGRDIAVAAVTIGDSSGKKPECSVQAERTEYVLDEAKDKVSVSFYRKGATETFSTVMVYRDGEAYGYFHFAPYQEIQMADLEAGNYETRAKQNCKILSNQNIKVAEKKADSKKVSKALNPAGDLDAIYEYDALPGSVSGEGSQATGKMLAGTKGASDPSIGNPSWFPEWTNKIGFSDYPDYKAYVQQQGSSLYKEVSVSNSHYHSYEYVNDRNRSHNGQSVYNTWRMNTSGFLSKSYNNVCKSVACGVYQMLDVDGGQFYEVEEDEDEEKEVV